ncbi:NAD(P)-dependent oxidoreductase [Chryseobacterium sp. Ch-15]|uniref:NAD(P)-dependent oxidoreductase n=1 Tax=Chryseobacterium muglaense TaxID=2893752 RepID=A0A9Q3UW27_9FLAO|nr:NAD(P)-dependent oxidoreductase [Chryseobacterium muglaense]MCC9036139.1 NAD(P)-dependent oxidoreductase [Chryseobacterium muglaense]MCM2553286.1 NAD(P)-dependent oxidoreductase [Chryseobacterium muglaense]
MKKKILITGANGFVGYHLLKAALREGFEVFAGIREGSDFAHLKNLDVQYSYLKYSDTNSLKKDFENKKYDYIIHAAGITKAANYETYERINADYTWNIAKAAETINPKKIIFISSLAALGPAKYDENEGLQENRNPKPVTNYGKSKLVAEQHIKKSSDLNWMIIRPTAVYGPREKDLLLIIKMINKGIEVYLGKNKQILSFIYVEDLADVAIKACLSEKVRECYNISDGHQYDTQKLSEIVSKELKKKTFKITIPISIIRVLANVMEEFSRGKPSILNKDKVRELIAENWHCSIEKAQQELGFEPQSNLEKGMKNTIEWYKNNKWI